MARNNQRGGKNNNPEGRNQYSSGWRDTARERPMTTAAAAAAAVGAGVFLWSNRNRISDQITNLSNQLSDWTQNQGWTGNREEELELAGTDSAFEQAPSRRSTSRNKA